jgi:surface antigen
MGIIRIFAGTALLALSLAGCASDPMDYSKMPREHGRSMVENTGQKPLQCVPYARAHSGIKIYGDAYTWWDQAAGRYPRGTAPAPGAVMVLHDYAGADHGHVAVVRTLVNGREIRVDHANWLDDGSIYVNDPVMDVSAENDWSAVRVFNIKTGAWGGKVYPVQGFIGSDRDAAPDEDSPDLVAQAGGGMGAVSFASDE